MSNEATHLDTAVIEFTESTIRQMVRSARFPADRLLKITREILGDEIDASIEWQMAMIRGEQSKPLIEARSGPAATTEDVAALLDCSDQHVRNLFQRGELIAYPALRGRGLRFPRWQLAGQGKSLSPKSWVAPLTAAFKGNGWGLVDFLTVPREPLGGLSYLASVEGGHEAIEAMLQAARQSNPD